MPKAVCPYQEDDIDNYSDLDIEIIQDNYDSEDDFSDLYIEIIRDSDFEIIQDSDSKIPQYSSDSDSEDDFSFDIAIILDGSDSEDDTIVILVSYDDIF
jgi:hypothetical protein